MSAAPSTSQSGGLSRVPYLPGLDGLRAIAVVAVMIYHANHDWLPGGFLGVEVFFVISGYLITLLLMGEHERTGGIDLRQFWFRRFRRLLPALYVMMALVAMYIAVLPGGARTDPRRLPGRRVYVSNWYQIWVGQGYGASEAFVPLRHLWSLAVEEQFYLVWPLVMVAILRRARAAGCRRWVSSSSVPACSSSWSPGSTCQGPVATSCLGVHPRHRGRCSGAASAVNDMLYLGSFSRAGGLMLGAGFAMLWRPLAIMRGPLRDKGKRLDLLAAVAGLAVLVYFMFAMYLQDRGVYNPWLFRGGFFAHRCGHAAADRRSHATRARSTGRLAGQQGAAVGRHPQLRPVPVPLAGVPDHPQAGQHPACRSLRWCWRWSSPCRSPKPATASSRPPSASTAAPPRLGKLKRPSMNVVAAGAVGLLLALLSAFSLMKADPHCVGEQNCANAASAADDTTARPPSVHRHHGARRQPRSTPSPPPPPCRRCRSRSSPSASR
jgi:peptidoglycan/LPS O-acetylase OafA/YrhL